MNGKNSPDDTPATKGDMQRLELRMNTLLAEINEKFDRQHTDIDRVLAVLINVDQRCKRTADDHEGRIATLEKMAA